MLFTGQFVEFETKRNGEEEELICDCNQESDGEVVIVQSMNYGHD